MSATGVTWNGGDQILARLEFTAYGHASPAGSKRAFHNARTGRVMVVDAAKGSRPWKAEVRDAALAAMTAHARTTSGTLIDAPLTLTLTFYVPRPKGHYGVRGLKDSAPEYPAKRPDLLKLARGIEDAMTGIVYRDDAQIVVEYLAKRYGEPERCEVIVEVLSR